MLPRVRRRARSGRFSLLGGMFLAGALGFVLEAVLIGLFWRRR
jgi:hypothetical protein